MINKIYCPLLFAIFASLGATLWAQVAPKPLPAVEPRPIDPNRVVITMGSVNITAGEFDAYLAMLPPDARSVAAQPSGRRSIADQLIEMKLLAREAESRRVDQDPRFTQQLKLMRDNLLVGLLLQGIDASEQEIENYYAKNKPRLEQVSARHIVITPQPPKEGETLTDQQTAQRDSEARAKAESIRKRLDAGEDFAAIAKAESMDDSAQYGGDLLPFTRGQMAAEFEQAAFALNINDISQPVKTEWGYHIIQVKQRRIPTFEEAHNAIADNVKHQKFVQLVEQLRKQADPKLDPTFFPEPKGPPAAANPGQ